MDKIAAVIVTYNRKALLLYCLEAIVDQTLPLEEIFIIDNASLDGTSLIIPNRQNITYIRLDKNIGGAGGFYTGMKIAYEKGYEWIWLMDDDVAPARDCLERLLEVAINVPEVMIAAPVKKFKDNRLGGAILSRDLSNPFLRRVKYFQLPADTDELQPFFPDSLDNYIIVSEVPFEGPLVKREAISKIGLPFKEFFIDGDDVEFCLRLSKYGKIVLCWKARINKLVPISNSLSWRTYYTHRNYACIDMLYGRNVFVKRLRPVIYSLRSILSLLVSLDIEKARMVMKAFYDTEPLWEKIKKPTY